MGIASGAGKAARSLSRYVKENRTLVVTSVCAIVLVMLLENVLDQESMKLDAAAWWLFGKRLRQPWLTPVMESFSALATPVTLLVVLGVAAAFTPVKRPGLPRKQRVSLRSANASGQHFPPLCWQATGRRCPAFRTSPP